MKVTYTWLLYSCLFFGTGVLCEKMCPSLVSDSVDIQCTHNSKYANCSNLSIPGTIAIPSCKPTFTTQNGQHETPLELLCQQNGKWNNELHRCSNYCGKVNIKNQIIKGKNKAVVGTAPWNVGIYELYKKDSNYDLICDGSLISPKLVVSVAHCFWKTDMLSNSISINDGQYKIAVGKYDRNIKNIDYDFTQIMDVEIIYLKEGYRSSRFHAEDIAIIVSRNRVSFSNNVAPVCIDWNGKYNVFNGDQGKVVSWGQTETGIYSPTLLEASLPYIDRSSCRNMYTNGFETYVTDDKFCAGSALVAEHSVDEGDIYSNLYYLTGIVSVEDPETKNLTAVSTEGSSILCDKKDDDSCSINTEDKFYCSNGLCIKSSWVCDGRKDCSDGSDENKELCALHKYGTNIFMNCGREYIMNHVLMANGEKAPVGTAPWNVGIYRLNNENSTYDLICEGSIISPNLVVSAAHCFWKKGMISNRIAVNDGLYKIAVGKYARDFTVIDNNFTKIINVEMIYLKEGYYGPTEFHAQDIAVIVLQDRVSFSNGIAPVCIDWNSEYNEVNGDQGKIVSWGNNENNLSYPGLLEISLPYISHDTCRKMYTNGFEIFVTADKFCAGSTLVSGQGVGRSGSGAGLTYFHSNSYYLTGVVSVKVPDTDKSIAVFTDVKYHIQWIRELYDKYVNVNVCVLPTVKGVVYSYEGSNDILSHGTLINHHRTVIENCEVGYHKAYPYGLRVCLEKGKWLSINDKLCLAMCPPLESDSLDIKCTLKGKYANCSTLSMPDTIATPSCKPAYTAPNGQDETPLELICQSDGTWNNQLYTCYPYCGRVYIKNQVLIDNGYEANIGTAPWNVGIYQLNKKKHNDYNHYDMICGGSIIAPNLVISAAHSFWKKGMGNNTILVNDDQYKIAVGKYTRDFSVIDNDFTQIINVEMIYLRDDYYGPMGFQAYDIAILVLQIRISFSNGVSPVCVDWYDRYNVINGDLGKIVGWGMTEKGIYSPTLLEASLPYIDHISCRNMYENGFESYVTVDKFCAGSELGQAVSRGDTGAGLTYSHSNSYYLTGVVSVKDATTNNSIAAFTDVKYHIQWIHKLYDKYVGRVTKNSCVLPTVKGVVYSYEGSNEVLSHGSLINYHRIVIENCELGFHKAYPNSFRFCLENGKWITASDKLCFKMCPPLLSDTLDIKCTLYGKYADCSNLTMANTIATASCKPTYTAPNEKEETPLVLYCQSNGTWNKQLYRCNPSISCILPTVEGVIYSYKDSNEVLSNGTLINHHLTVIENCEVGYHKAYPNGFRFCQENGKWLSNSDKLCLKMCPPLESDSLNIKCSHNGKYANCSTLSIPNTIATPSCKPTYTAPNGQDETPLELICQSDGTWNKQLYRCIPYCGREYIMNHVLMVNSNKAPVGTAPWNVGIYQLNKKNSNYDIICGGSIIAPNLVVSAAHCFWQKGMVSKRISINDGLYKIAVGKYDRNFTVIDNDFTQIINVEMIYLNDDYYGPIGFHAQDIAILVLKIRVSFSNGVSPVCVDWNGKHNVVNNGDHGKIVGWGKTEKGISSPFLLEASLPYIDHSSCRDMYTNGFELFVTVDKFCAGSALVSGQGANKGDSGAGLCFVHSNTYYLTGIVSLKDPDTTNSIAVFTDVKHHIQWIRGLYNKYN